MSERADCDYGQCAFDAIERLTAERDRWQELALKWAENDDILRRALTVIANEDYRGNRPRSLEIASRALGEATYPR